MYIQNAVYKAVPTGSLEFPVAEGTIITAGDVTGIVPQNVALAPPTAMIYVATGGTIDLTSEANKGVTFTEAQIKELGSDFNFIPAQEGGGSSLPPYTSADKGKGLFLVDADPVETAVVPEQTVTLTFGNSGDASEAAVLSGATWNVANIGDDAIVSIDGSPYETEITDSLIGIGDVEKGVSAGLTTKFEIYLNDGVTYVWASGHGKGTYDFVVSVKTFSIPTTEKNIVPEQTVTVESGPVPLVGADASGFVVGNTGVMTVNGTDYNVTATDMNGAIVYGGQEIGFMIAYADGEVMCVGEPGTYTVSLSVSVPELKPKWKTANGGGALIVKATGEATLDGGDITVNADISVADFVANIESPTFTPIYVIFPRMGASIQGYYDYEHGLAAIYSTLNLLDNNIVKFQDPENTSYFYTFGFNGDASALVFAYGGR